MSELRILHMWADVGIEDEVLHTFGDVTRVGIDPAPNPFSDVIQADARDPPLSATWDLAVVHPRCQRFSVATAGGQARWDTDTEHPNDIPDARRVCRKYADHWIIENVPQAPLRDPVVFHGGMFGLPIHYPRAFETSFDVARPAPRERWSPDTGPLAKQDETGGAWVGRNVGWRLAKGYAHDWPARALKRHAVPSPYLRRLLYYWLAAREDGTRSEQMALADGAGYGGTDPREGGAQ
jgi:hypothetical protein